MKLARRKVLQLAAGAAALPALPRFARAETYPSRPIRLIVGFPAGGGVDLNARPIGQWLSDRLGQQVVIENRPGAGSNIATESVVRAAPDGYTLLAVSMSAALNTSLYDKLNYNFLRDIAPVGSTMRLANLIVVNPAVPAKTIPEFIAYAKANPGKVNMASAGNGTTGHIFGELFNSMAGVKMVHVPYRGGAPALTDLIGGQVQVYFSPIPEVIEHVRAGKLRALAVTTGTRWETLPDIPAVGEYLPGYDASGWHGIGVPTGTPVEIIERLNKEINAGLADPQIKARAAEMGEVTFPGTPAAFGKLIADETEKWGKVVRASNIKGD
jgi:tripartite-type tricarboxylate transporter receptor subunit TctC